MKYRGYYITTCDDIAENEGGLYCQVYADENCGKEVDDFCIHADELAQHNAEFWIKRHMDEAIPEL